MVPLLEEMVSRFRRVSWRTTLPFRGGDYSEAMAAARFQKGHLMNDPFVQKSFAETMRDTFADKNKVAEINADLDPLTTEELKQRFLKSTLETARNVILVKELVKRPDVTEAQKRKAQDFLAFFPPGVIEEFEELLKKTPASDK
jgi:hypothetical protein